MAKKNKKKKAKPVPTLLTNFRDVQIDIPEVHFENAADFKAAYDSTDTAVKQAADSSVDNQVELIAALARMRSLLSERGDQKQLREQAGVKIGWVEYFKWFKKTYDIQMCLRTAINRIDRLAGKKVCKSCGKVDGHTPSCHHRKATKQPLDNRVCCLVAGVNAAHELVKAIEQGGNVPEAVREFKDWAPSPERLEQIIGQQTVPYEPKSGDLLLVNGHQVVVQGVQGVRMDGGQFLLTIAVEPVRRQPVVPKVVAPMPPTNASTDSDDDDSLFNAAVA